MASKPYNGLSGLEVRRMVFQEITDTMALDPRFERADPIGSAVLTFTLRIDHKSAPADDASTFSVQTSQPFKDDNLIASDLPGRFAKAIDWLLSMDLRFGNNVVYPFVTWNHRLSVVVTRPDGTTLPEVEIVAPESPVANTGIKDRPADRGVDLRAAVTRPVPVQASPAELRRQALEKEIERLRAELDGPAVDLRDDTPVDRTGLTAAELRPHLVQSDDADEMKISWAWKPLADPMSAVASSGSGAAMSVVTGRTARGESMGVTPEMLNRPEEIEIETRHPALQDGATGSPDAMRRQHGLPVPSPQAGKSGGIVDLPAGVF
jgi:hypothetical protein